MGEFLITMETLRTPSKRCYLTLGLALVGLVFVGFSASQSNASLFYIFLYTHLPVALFLPLFIVAGQRALTPVTLSLSFSMSVGLFFMSDSILLLVGPSYGPIPITLIMGVYFLIGWFFFSFLQAGIHSSYGFSSRLPVLYIGGGPFFGLIGTELPAVSFCFGLLYFFMAARGVRRVTQTLGRQQNALAFARKAETSAGEAGSTAGFRATPSAQRPNPHDSGNRPSASGRRSPDGPGNF